MGYMVHHAIIVTGRDDLIREPHRRARELFHGVAAVSSLVPSPVNGYESFFVAPDGSKSGWEQDLAGDTAREAFADWLIQAAYPVEWAEVQYGDESGDQKIVRASY